MAKNTKRTRKAQAAKPLVIFNRIHDGRAWTYRDQDEANFLWWLWPEISLESIDDFIEGRQGVMLPDHMRAELLDTRSEAVNAYRAGKHELAVAHAGRLQEKCRLFGMYFATKPAVVAAQKRDKALPKARKKATNQRRDDANKSYGALKKIVEKPTAWKYTAQQLVVHEWAAISKLGYTEKTAKRYIEEIRAAIRKP